MNKLVLTLIIIVVAAFSVPQIALSDYQRQQVQANSLYQSGDYANAYKKYEELARKGDSFSQYRVSYMHLTGQGKRQDVIESIAWSVLAAQNRQEELVDYMQTIAGLVPADQRKKADKKISYYMRKWGNEADSGRPRDEGICTGFRLCNQKSKPRSAHVPRNLWENSGGDSVQLKEKLEGLNQTILKSYDANSSAAG